jgi:transcriptional regulator with XRE-family HTH domain
MRNPTRSAIATEVSVAALRAGASQNAIASHLGISQAAFSRRMTGDVDFRVSELRAISAFLNVPLEQLLVEEPASEEASA